MIADELDRLERERRDADRRYNEALTALDAAVVNATATAPAAPDAVARLGTALMVFLQQITAFVETKDREIAADAARRVAALTPALEALAELRTKVGVVERTTRSLARERAPIGPAAVTANELPRPATLAESDGTYVGFEDEFRGSADSVAARVGAHVPLFAGRTNVLDIGCGRGELLAALAAAGVPARGVDANAEMVAVARERGLDATHGDALQFLASLPDGALGGLVATQVIEHFEAAYLMRLIALAAAKLRDGAPIVLETINPACWLAFFSSYIRDLTHVHPVHPDTLQYLLRAHGFSRVEIRYSAPVPDAVKMKTIDLPADVLASSDAASVALARMAHAINANAVILNNLMFTHLDYAAVGYRS